MPARLAALGVVAAIPTGGLSLAGGVLGRAGGGGVIGEFFHKGLKMTEEEMARIGRALDAGHASVGVLTWDFETDAVTDRLGELTWSRTSRVRRGWVGASRGLERRMALGSDGGSD